MPTCVAGQAGALGPSESYMAVDSGQNAIQACAEQLQGGSINR
jgi:hypothetical protein